MLGYVILLGYAHITQMNHSPRTPAPSPTPKHGSYAPYGQVQPGSTNYRGLSHSFPLDIDALDP
jgi:hypothetical protein